MGITAKIETVTPNKAKEWLKTNEKNFRALNHRRVQLYIKAIKRGEWHENGESLKFDTDGKLIDGQHRLTAVMLAEKSIKSIVVRGVQPERYSSIDRGMVRTLPQFLKGEGIPYGSNLAAISRLVLVHKAGKWNKGDNTFRPTDGEQIEFIERNLNKLLPIMKLSCSGMCPASIIHSILFLGSPNNKYEESETAIWFYEHFLRGNDLTDLDAVFHCRNKFINQKASKRSSLKRLNPFAYRMMATIAWNRTVEGVATSPADFTMTGPTAVDLPEKVLVAPKDSKRKKVRGKRK